MLILMGLSMGAGCSTAGRIKTKATSLFAVKDAGKPATLDENTEVATLPLPAGSKLTVTKIEPMAATPAAQGRTESPASPGREITEVTLPRDTEWRRAATRIIADTGVVDTSIAKHRIDAEESRFLLWASLGALGAAGVFLYLKYPTPALMCGAASVVLFIAWKLAGLPPWFHVIGFCAVVGAFMLWRGHARGEADGIKAALTGDVEPKNPPVVKSP
jgi:hypothetical protein